MRRRDLLAAAGLTGLAPLGGITWAKDAGASKKELYELRLYQMASQALLAFLAKAAIPAWNRIGIKPVGVLTMADEKNPDLYVLLPHPSLESVMTATSRLLADAEFLKAGASFLDAAMKDPAFKRIESSLLLAFDECPKVEVPKRKESRVFELRVYESHSVKKGQKKIEMFNAGGEVAIFRQTGPKPVFYGEAIIGTKLPNLTYMVVHDDMEAKDKNWKSFGSSAAWKKLRSDPAYKDTVSHITKAFLKPAACSQI